VADPFFIDENIRGGVAYLAELKHLFHGDLRFVMPAYPRGSGR
jgi:soluble lytic murein transglycosylase-like protein